METVEGTSDEPLSPAERAELVRLRRQVAEQEKHLAFRLVSPIITCHIRENLPPG
jgi:hypothetical protein